MKEKMISNIVVGFPGRPIVVCVYQQTHLEANRKEGGVAYTAVNNI